MVAAEGIFGAWLPAFASTVRDPRSDSNQSTGRYSPTIYTKSRSQNLDSTKKTMATTGSQAPKAHQDKCKLGSLWSAGRLRPSGTGPDASPTTCIELLPEDFCTAKQQRRHRPVRPRVRGRHGTHMLVGKQVYDARHWGRHPWAEAVATPPSNGQPREVRAQEPCSRSGVSVCSRTYGEATVPAGRGPTICHSPYGTESVPTIELGQQLRTLSYLAGRARDLEIPIAVLLTGC